jgi:hypothetical protein
LGHEKENFLETVNKWLLIYLKNKKNKDKNIKLWGEVIDNYSVFLPRFIHPVKPPKNCTIRKDSKYNPIEYCARYVSLIPYRNDSSNFDGLPEMWCTC